VLADELTRKWAAELNDEDIVGEIFELQAKHVVSRPERLGLGALPQKALVQRQEFESKIEEKLIKPVLKKVKRENVNVLTRYSGLEKAEESESDAEGRAEAISAKPSALKNPRDAFFQEQMRRFEVLAQKREIAKQKRKCKRLKAM